MSTTTPNMNLIESTVAVDTGLLWEQNLNSSLTIIDQHNHSSGSGVQITPSGLNINAPLTFSNQPVIDLKSVVFNPQTSLSTLYALYSIGNDLYFNDGTANIIQLTSGGVVNATSSGISSGTATASFVSSVLVVNAAANIPANIQGGSILLGNNSLNSKFLNLSPPSAMGANFSLTLPSLPVVNSFVFLDSSGNFGTKTAPSTPAATSFVTIDTSGNYAAGAAVATAIPSVYGTAFGYTNASCNWTGNSSSFASFAANANCIQAGTVTGGVSAPATKIPGFVMTSAPAGTYKVTATFTGTSTSGNPSFRISDGTTFSPPVQMTGGSDAASERIITLTGIFIYGSSGTRSIEVQYRDGGSNTQLTANSAFIDLYFVVERYP